MTLGLAELVVAARLAGDVPAAGRHERAPGRGGPADRPAGRYTGPPGDASWWREELAPRRRRRTRRWPRRARRPGAPRRRRRARPGRRGRAPDPRGRPAVGGARRLRRTPGGRGAAALVVRCPARPGRPADHRRARSTSSWRGSTRGCGCPRWRGRSPSSRGCPSRRRWRCPTTSRCRASCSPGSEKAHRDHRTDLLAPMAATYLGAGPDGRAARGAPGRLRGDAGPAPAPWAGRVVGGCGCSPPVGTDPPTPAVSAWLLFDDGWHELRPGRDATSVLRRREPRDLGLFTLPLVDAVTDEGGA